MRATATWGEVHAPRGPAATGSMDEPKTARRKRNWGVQIQATAPLKAHARESWKRPAGAAETCWGRAGS
eukprot:13191528-Alexandrium_andersonii.AAC.1